MADRILVTGGSGFIASHTIKLLAERGYDVRLTARNDEKAAAAIADLAGAGVETTAIETAVADLTRDEGWAEAATDCQGLFHMASPFPLEVPKDPQQLIRPAVEGTLRVLTAARNAGVGHVVLTSSLAAISYGRGGRAQKFTEQDWTDPDGPDSLPYTQSKTLAERAAWKFMNEQSDGMTMASVNPGVVFGPLLADNGGSSLELVRSLMTGRVPAAPRAGFCVVDVRDVADLHLRAYEQEAAKGERFICANGWMWMKEMGRYLKEAFPEAARRAPVRELPGFAVRLFSLLDPSARQILAELNQLRDVDNSKARDVLGWSPRSKEEALQASAQSLIDLGLL